MSRHTHLIERSEFLHLALQVLGDLRDKYAKLAGTFLVGNDSSSFSGKGIFSLAATLTSKPTSLRKQNIDFVEACVVSQLLEIVEKAERLSEGAGSVAFETCVRSFIDRANTENTAVNTTLAALESRKQLEALGELLGAHACPYTKAELYEDIEKKLDGPNDLSVALLSALDLAGVQGNIRVEASGTVSMPQVEKKSGYHFTGVTVPLAFTQNVTREWTRREVKVLCVDGVVEKVSELDKILSEANTTKQGVLIVAQGFSDEVLGTLQLNFGKKLLDVVPALLEPSLETLNVVNDVSVVCGRSSLVSTLQGEMLLYKTLDSLPVVDKVTLSGNTLLVQNQKTRAEVVGHIKGLLEKRTQKQAEGFQLTDLAMLYEKRIHSLMANTIVLTLPATTEGVATSKREKIDRVLRSVKTKLAYGKINLDGFLSEHGALENLGVLAVKNIKAADDSSCVDHLATYVGIWFGVQKASELLGVAGFVATEV
jgi:hypothetical protein